MGRHEHGCYPVDGVQTGCIPNVRGGVKSIETHCTEKAQALAALNEGIERLNTFTYQEATCAEFLLWRTQMLETLIVLLGENALSVFEWRVMRFVPASAYDEAHAQLVWKSSQKYARLLLRSVQVKQQKT